MTAEQEREAIVKWLRSQKHGSLKDLYGSSFARAIESGAHLSQEPKP